MGRLPFAPRPDKGAGLAKDEGKEMDEGRWYYTGGYQGISTFTITDHLIITHVYFTNQIGTHSTTSTRGQGHTSFT